MHCPRCGQEQASGSLKFCSRCGLPMELVSALVANGGTLPELSALNSQQGLLTRSNGLKFSLLWFLVLNFLLVPLLAILGGEEIVALLAVIGFVGAVIMVVLSFLFLKNPPKQVTQASFPSGQQEIAGAAGVREALPQSSAQPAADFVKPPGSWRAPDTGDLVQPGSVTEGTTKLLKKEEGETEQ